MSFELRGNRGKDSLDLKIGVAIALAVHGAILSLALPKSPSAASPPDVIVVHVRFVPPPTEALRPPIHAPLPVPEPVPPPVRASVPPVEAHSQIRPAAPPPRPVALPRAVPPKQMPNALVAMPVAPATPVPPTAQASPMTNAAVTVRESAPTPVVPTTAIAPPLPQPAPPEEKRQPVAAHSDPLPIAPQPREASPEPRAPISPANGEDSGPLVEAQPKYRSNPKPSYPASARRRGQTGVSLLRVSVDADGHPTAVSLERSSGYDALDRAALESVRNWDFQPATKGGKAVASTVFVPVRFSLEN
jgi:protein TonB